METEGATMTPLPWTAREAALAVAVALLFVIAGILATEGLATLLLARGGP